MLPEPAMKIKEAKSHPSGEGEGVSVTSAASDDALRRRAEAIAQHEHAGLNDQTELAWPGPAQQTLHELRVHQIELEMQNEELRRAQAELDIQRERYFDIYDNAPVGYCIVNDRELIVEANLTAATLLGVARNALIKQPIFRLLRHEGRPIFHQMCQRLLAGGEPQTCEVQLVENDTAHTWVHLTASAAHDDAGKPVMRIVLSDISERKRIQSELQNIREFSENIVETMREPLLVLNARLEVVSANPGFYKTFKASPAQTIGKAIYDLGDGQWNIPKLRVLFEEIIPNSSVFDGYLVEHDFPGVGRKTMILNAREIIQQSRGQKFILLVMEDITERQMAEGLVRHHLAYYDALTRLANRELLKDRLLQSMKAGQRSGRYGALVFLDIDNFKSLNDTQGHTAGDLLLMEVAERLRNCVRQIDSVARFGGDEFVVLLNDLPADRAQARSQAGLVAEKIRSVLAIPYALQVASTEGSLPQPLIHNCTASLGVVLFLGREYSEEEIIKWADLAMYKAKDEGRNTLCFFDSLMQIENTARVVLEEDLREALLKKQFTVYYQAQVSGKSEITGVEALLRWQHPVRGWVTPYEFIPKAETTGLILPLGLWVLETACTQLALWALRPGTAHLTIAVNVTARQFHQADFLDQVMAVAERTGANLNRLKLELTESVLIADVESVITKMNTLKNKGVSFSLDDFGTGYSSLSALKRLPLDQLKIGQNFVRDILVDPDDAAIARMVVALTESMGLAVIAEGVESEAQRDFLAGLGCHNYQGYLFSEALPAKEFEALMARLRA